MASNTTAMMSNNNSSSSNAPTARAYRNDPYAFSVLPESFVDVAARSCFSLYATPSPTAAADINVDLTDTSATDACADASACTANSSKQHQQQLFSLLCGNEQQDGTDGGSGEACDGDDHDAGVSETSSECCTSNGSRLSTTQQTATTVTATATAATMQCDRGASSNPCAQSHDALAATTASECAGGVSGVLDASTSCMMPMLPRLTVFRYASVDFRFGSAWFLAPFRTFVGDMVVVEYAGNNHRLHMGLVSCITTMKPHTFYSDDNHDPNYLTDEELSVLPRLLRHARDHDRETKLELRRHDLRALANARSLAAEMHAPVTFLDAEWLLDLSAITFLVHVYGDVAAADCLADELAAQEGAEVVFTYPTANMMTY